MKLKERLDNEMTSVLFFSRDRPLQLAAALGSFYHHCSDAQAVFVLYRTQYMNEYSILRVEYPEIHWILERDFYEDCTHVIGTAQHVLFVVDDTIFLAPFSIAENIALLRDPKVLGVSLRLGLNTTYNYPAQQGQYIPPFQYLEKWCKFSWPGRHLDFSYPLELSSSLYRSKDLQVALQDMRYHNPNELEGLLACQSPQFQSSHPYLICYHVSRACSIPANRVQDAFPNRCATDKTQSAEELLQRFRDGYHIDFRSLEGWWNNACHQEITYSYLRPPHDSENHLFGEKILP